MAPPPVPNDVSCTPEEWDRLVSGHPRATLYHTWRWSDFAGSVFDFPLYRLVERGGDGHLLGVLPLVLQKSLVFGRRLVSMPFFNYGGPLAESTDVEDRLIERAVELARTQAARTLEIRDQVPRDRFAVREDKVTVELALPESEEALAKSLGSKLRSQVRRSERESPRVALGGLELVDDFYAIFAATMRDLGTPVYPKRFFKHMLSAVGGDCTVVVVSLHGRPAAAAILTHFQHKTEIPWAASLRELRATSVNMKLYWECLRHAISRGSRVFDFGRSTRDAGTYRFKMQWGSEARQLYWIYPLQPTERQANGDGPGLRERAQSAWSRLPLGVANALGPWISPGLPW